MSDVDLKAAVAISMIGHNLPPKSPFELSSNEIENLYLEACNWADGQPITHADQDAAVDSLIDKLRAAAKLADARRVEENKPFDEGKAEVQARYNPLIQPKRGKTELAIDALKKLVAPYRQRIADEKAAEATRLRLDAEAKRKAAEDALRASQVDDLAQRAAAEALVLEAQKAAKASTKADKAATTGLGLRTTYRAEIISMTEFARYVWTNHQADLAEFLTELAPRLVNRGLHTMPGVTVTEERKAV